MFDGFETKFCLCCSLKQLQPQDACPDDLYLKKVFYKFEEFAKNSSGKKCDILFCKNNTIVLIELKALNWFVKKRSKDLELKEPIKNLQEELRQKLFDSIDYIREKSAQKQFVFPYYIVAFSKDIVHRPGYESIDISWLKYYLQNRLFPVPINTLRTGTHIVVRECSSLEKFL